MHNQTMKNFICLLLLTAILGSGLSSGLLDINTYQILTSTSALHSVITPEEVSAHSSICTEELLGRQPILQVLRRGRQAYDLLRLRLETFPAVMVLPLLYAIRIRHLLILCFYPITFSIIVIIHYIQQIDGKKSRFLFIPY